MAPAAATGLELAEADRPDVLHMPGMDGITATAQLRQRLLATWIPF